MKFVLARNEIACRRFVNLIDGPRIPHPDSAVRGKLVELIKVEVRYVLVGDGWQVDTFAGGLLQVTGDGWILKQDGTRSQRMWRGQILTAPSRTENGWLKKLIDGMRPSGKPELPFDVTEV
jgi:hypothetical protein